MSRGAVNVLVIMVSLFALALASCATTPDVMPGDAVANRQRLMRLMGGSWADIQAKAKAGNIEAVAVNAETIAVSSYHIPALFPQGSATSASKAKPEIWQRKAEFDGLAANLRERAEALRDAARAKNAAQVEGIVKEFGAKACGACHQPFRQPAR
jgi:cytochrome c556